MQDVIAGAVQSVPIAYIRDAAIITTLVYFSALLYAAVQDYRTKEVGDYIHVIIAVASLIGFDRINLPAMLLGAVVTALPLFIAGTARKGSVGGADIKLMAASGLLLGAGKGMIALIIGLFLGTICTFVFRKIKKIGLKTSFPLIPFLAAGCVIAHLL